MSSQKEFAASMFSQSANTIIKSTNVRGAPKLDMKAFLTNILRQNDVYVTFKKVDGTERTMLCSLNDKYLPPVDPDKKPRKVPENQLPVWDLSNDSWRSFRVDSVINIEIVP